jgi:uncharacterized protein YkwD
MRHVLFLLFFATSILVGYVAPAQAGRIGAWLHAPTAAAAAEDPAAATPAELIFLDLVNADRRRHGLPPLTMDQALLPIARGRAAAQLSGAPLNHYDAAGELAFVPLLSDARVDYALAGENLARSVGADGRVLAQVEQALMRSPMHRKNILEPTFNRVAIGAAVDAATGHVAYAQIFISAP